MKAACFALIMAGGRGTRFWPASRTTRPKQLLRVLGGRTLIRETAERVAPLVGPERTLVVTVAEHADAVRAELSELARANFLVEPIGRNTAPCVGLAAVAIARRAPDAVMIALPADHWISDAPAFRRTLKTALRLAGEHEAAVTIGIKPAYPESGYGYIIKGGPLGKSDGVKAYRVRGFTEKPSPRRAAALIRGGALWNSGIFVWKAATILELIRRYSPEISHRLERIRDAWSTARRSAIETTILREYRRMPSISVDYAVLEPAGADGRVLVVEGDFGWSDLGSWAALHRLLERDARGNGGVGRWLAIGSAGCMVYSPDRLVVLLGVKGTLVADSPDALLVADLGRSQEIREVVAELERRGLRRYLL
jgi:mannose-1-phosphate guanylyltransferase